MATGTLNRRRGTAEPPHGTAEEHWALAGHYDPEFKDAIASELARLAALPQNWDQYGAPPINPKIIEAATNFVRALPENIAYRPRVVPMSPGNLQFEWHQGRKVLELEFESPQTIRFLQWHPEVGIEEEDSIKAIDVDRAVDLIHWFMSGTTCV